MKNEIPFGAVGFLIVGVLFLTAENYNYHGVGFSENHTKALGVLFLSFSLIFYVLWWRNKR